MRSLWFCGAGVAFGTGLWLLYRGRIYVAAFAARLRLSPLADRLLRATVAGLITLLLALGCRLVVLLWGGT
ncbi:MAG: hypothetical protein Q9O62_04300 [Ardenticatenia bacterium]|nr:hypothetical protein [Ardenticatenia bacterium]